MQGESSMCVYQTCGITSTLWFSTHVHRISESPESNYEKLYTILYTVLCTQSNIVVYKGTVLHMLVCDHQKIDTPQIFVGVRINITMRCQCVHIYVYECPECNYEKLHTIFYTESEGFMCNRSASFVLVCEYRKVDTTQIFVGTKIITNTTMHTHIHSCPECNLRKSYTIF